MKIIRIFYSLIAPIIISGLLVIGIGWEESLDLEIAEHRLIGLFFIAAFLWLMNRWTSCFEQYTVRTNHEKFDADKRKTNR